MSAVIQWKLPQRSKDPNMFTVPYVFGNHKLEKTMLDLGALINVMPLSIYKDLNLVLLKETKVIIQLAKMSNSYLKGIVEDVLIIVNELIFHVDFYTIDIDDEFASNPTQILLDGSFMKTTRTKIDVYTGTLSFEFDGEKITFNIFDAMKYPEESEYVCYVDVIDPIMQDDYEHNFLKDELNFVLQHNKIDKDARLKNNEDMKEAIMSFHSIFKNAKQVG